MDDDINEQGAPFSPHFRVWLCGAFRVERRVGTTYEGVRTAEWGGSSYPRLLLKALVCCPGRQARREALIEMLWPETDPELAVHYLNTATTKLRTVLRHAKGQDSLLVTENDSTLYRLAGQPLLWVDADEGVALLKEAEQRGRTFPEALPLLEEAAEYFNKGAFLQEDEGFWAAGRRATVEQIRYRCRLWLAEAYTQHGMPGHAETVLSSLVEEDPFDEDALCRLMALLQSQGMTHQALRLYHQTRQLFAQEQMELTEATKAFATHLQEKRSSLVRETFFTEHEDQTGEVRKMTRSKSDDGIQAITSELSSRPWTVPYPRNPFFTGREDLLTSLHTRFLAKEQFGGITQHALCGLGGVGKTQLALEYAYRYQQEYHAIFWIKADTRENLFADFLSLAQLLTLPERDSLDQVVATAAIQRWLQEHTGWLLVFDNADTLEIVREVLPTGCQGHVLLTTRAQAMGRVAHRLEVEEMSLETGALFLLRRAGLIEPDAPLEKASEKDLVLAEELIQELGGLPLALDQAGAYIEETASSLQEYLDFYHTHRLALLQRRGGLTTDHPESVATTWALAFTRIESSDPMAADLLRLCAFLDPDAIPEEILFTGLQQLAGTMRELHRLRFNEALGSLLRFSLVRRNADTHTITVHRLIQSVVRDNLHSEQQAEWIHKTVLILADAFPSAVEVTNWSLCEKFLPHALLCAHWMEQADITSMKAASLLDTVGYYLNMRARYEMAKPLLKLALRLREQGLGEQHPDTAQTLSNLAYLYHHQDQFEEAMHFLQRSLSLRQQVLGMEHPDTATSLNALGLLYRDQGRYEEAEPFFQRALAIRKQIFGIEHPQTAHSLSNLAWLYRNQGRYEEAEPLYVQSLTMRKRIRGVDHPDTASSLNGLALLYTAQKNYEKAEPLFQQALTIRKQVLGTKHLHTTQSMNALALLYCNQGEYEKAERLFLEVVAIREHLFGSSHPRTLVILNNLTRCQRNMKK
ncbi:MAG: tetratricopeptide repeat protein [Ktedonobacteraceae bacterium]|nr:tetratricopeptide repeat protein [Ktedonobacteraceae bacterium]